MYSSRILKKFLWNDKHQRKVNSFIGLADLVKCCELSSEFDSETGNKNLKSLLAFLLMNKNDDEAFKKSEVMKYRKILRDYGLVITNDGDLFIAYTSEGMEKLLTKYSNEKIWKYFLNKDESLKRASHESKNIDGKGHRGVRLSRLVF